MKEELTAGEVNKQIVTNVQELLGALPKMSPYRLSLFFLLRFSFFRQNRTTKNPDIDTPP